MIGLTRRGARRWGTAPTGVPGSSVAEARAVVEEGSAARLGWPKGKERGGHNGSCGSGGPAGKETRGGERVGGGVGPAGQARPAAKEMASWPN